MTDITKIRGIGPTLATELAKSGIKSTEGLANASVATLSQVRGVSATAAPRLIAAATAALAKAKPAAPTAKAADWAAPAYRGAASPVKETLSERQLLRTLAIANIEGRFQGIRKTPESETREDLWAEVVKKIGADTPVSLLEFGVYKGNSMRFWASEFGHAKSTFHGFDSFEGLPEDWAGKMVKGTFSTDGTTPDVADHRVNFYKGWIQNTLPDFLHSKSVDPSNTLIVHIDVDIYSAALFVLCACWFELDEFYIIFDEFAVDENLAMEDFIAAFPVEYEFYNHTMNPNSRLARQVFGHIRKTVYVPKVEAQEQAPLQVQVQATTQPDRISKRDRDAKGRGSSKRLYPHSIAPDLPANVTSMMWPLELDMLYSISRDYVTGAGRIVDAGIYLGASTFCFARGLSDNATDFPAPIIHSYERATIMPAMLRDPILKERFPERRTDYSDYLRELLEPVAPMVELNCGDIMAEDWTHGPIEVLFLDVLKTRAIARHCNQTFLPHLIPGRSLVIQQDFFWHLDWWINAFMALHQDYFEVVDDAETSCVFLNTKALPADLDPDPFNKMRPSEVVELLEISRNWSRTEFQRAMSDLCIVNYLTDTRKLGNAENRLNKLSPIMENAFKTQQNRADVRRAFTAYRWVSEKFRKAKESTQSAGAGK